MLINNLIHAFLFFSLFLQHRCMQPRDIPIKTPENDRRLKKKLDKMMEGLISSSPVGEKSTRFFFFLCLFHSTICEGYCAFVILF